MFYVIAIGHCEGPDHLERMDLCIRLVDEMKSLWPEALAPLAEGANGQNRTVRGVIERFGRHPPKMLRDARMAAKRKLRRGVETTDERRLWADHVQTLK